MSIRNALMGSLVGLAISGTACGAAINLLKNHMKKESENDEGNVLSLSQNFNLFAYRRIADAVVLCSGLVGFYYGYNKKGNLLLKND
tara:strand:+ start:1002 stop:1262 length:261 start_codon:yes stop_codon:yes gene_type:complete